MKLEVSRGCTTFGSWVNGENFSNLPIDKQKSVILSIINSIPDDKFPAVFDALIEELGVYEEGGYCDQCNDSYDSTILEIKDSNQNNKPYKVAIWWSTEDFAAMAEQLFELMTSYSENSPKSVQKHAKEILATCKDWKDCYDETKFEEALDTMIQKHDAEYGITWESIKYYLNEMCLKNNKI